jgi:hypothetical protein
MWLLLLQVKYPTVDEAYTFGLRPAERNAYVEAILDIIFAHAGARPLIFSSFDPDTCLMLSRKQVRLTGRCLILG